MSQQLVARVITKMRIASNVRLIVTRSTLYTLLDLNASYNILLYILHLTIPYL